MISSCCDANDEQNDSCWFERTAHFDATREQTTVYVDKWNEVKVHEYDVEEQKMKGLLRLKRDTKRKGEN